MAITPFQRKQLARRIDRRRGALLAELRGSTHDGTATDVDIADDTRDMDELRELEAARERLKDRRYGACADCRSDIPYARLKAAPEALRCERCQERHEKTFAGGRKPKL